VRIIEELVEIWLNKVCDIFPTLKTLNYYYLLPPDHPLFHSTLHHSTLQYFKLILGNDSPLLSFLFIPAVAGQVPKLLATSTQLPLPCFQFFPQFGEGASFLEQASHELFVLD